MSLFWIPEQGRDLSAQAAQIRVDEARVEIMESLKLVVEPFLPDPPDAAHQGEWLWIASKISDLLDAVSAPLDVMLERVAHRTTNPYGKTAVECAMIEADFFEVQPLLRAGCTHELDAARPLRDVVADLIAIASSVDASGRATASH